jgi:hypothetical protein
VGQDGRRLEVRRAHRERGEAETLTTCRADPWSAPAKVNPPLPAR